MQNERKIVIENSRRLFKGVQIIDNPGNILIFLISVGNQGAPNL